MSKKLYVGNMPFTTTEEQLRELFGQAGEIESVAIITDRETGRSKGFGFVEMATDEGGEEAIKRFNNFSMGNRNLTVSEARPREERPARNNYGNDRGGYGGGRRDDGGRRDNGNFGGGNRKRF
jgi:cold-inducible RNA-binding protein